MKYMMEQKLVDVINAQRAEAIEFSKQPNCWMGMYIEPSDTKYWSWYRMVRYTYQSNS